MAALENLERMLREKLRRIEEEEAREAADAERVRADAAERKAAHYRAALDRLAARVLMDRLDLPAA